MRDNDPSPRPLILYLGTDSNKIVVVKQKKKQKLQDNDNDNDSSCCCCNFEIIQTIHPVGPNPLKLPEGVYNGISTEWISKHPNLPILYVLTSYWNAMESCITTFQISEDDGTLLLSSPGPAPAPGGRGGEEEAHTTDPTTTCSSTGGLHAAHATFSPDGKVYVIAHHNDGKLIFLDVSTLENALQPSDHKLLVIETPQVIPGTRRQTRPSDGFPGLPSLHHVQYTTGTTGSTNNGQQQQQQFLITVDPSQDTIFTYRIDSSTNLPTTTQPISQFKCYSDVPIRGIFQRLITKYVLKCKRRTRKVVIHPNGRYIYVLYESINRLQVYSIDNNDTGIIDYDKQSCLQDLSTLDPAFYNNSNSDYDTTATTTTTSSSSSSWLSSLSCSFVWMTLQLAAEICLTKDGSTLLVSNRGDGKLPYPLSRAESSIRIFKVCDDGRRLEPAGALPHIAGPVRHFLLLEENNDGENDTKIIAGLSQSKGSKSLQVFGIIKNRNEKEKEEEANNNNKPMISSDNVEVIGDCPSIDANVFCIAV